MLVYLLAPSASALQTNSKKIRLDFVGPLVIQQMLDQSHTVLETLEGHRLPGIFHVNRIKVAWVRTDAGSVNHVKDLKQDQRKNMTKDTGSHSKTANLLNYCLDDPEHSYEYHKITKARLKQGNLQILVNAQGDSNSTNTWIDMKQNPQCSEYVDSLLNDKHFRITGRQIPIKTNTISL